jgi:hypothetical protein
MCITLKENILFEMVKGKKMKLYYFSTKGMTHKNA